MVKPNAIQPGARVRYHNAEGYLHQLNQNQYVINFDDSSIKALPLTEEELNSQLYITIFYIKDQFVNTLPKELDHAAQIELSRKRGYLKELYRLTGPKKVGGKVKRKQAIENYLTKHKDDKPPSISQLAEWAKMDRQHASGIAASALNTTRKARTSKYDGPILLNALKTLDEMFLVQKPSSIQDMFDTFITLCKTELKKELKELPTYETFRGWVHGICPELKIKKQRTRKEIKRLLRNATKKYLTSRPLERVEADGLKIAIGVLDELGRYLGTLLFIILIDCHTRMIVGYEMQVGKGEASSTIIAAIRHALLPKHPNTLSPRCKYGMPLHGVIEVLVIDGGTGFSSIETMSFALWAGIEVTIVESYAPWLKPFIERLNLTIRQKWASNIKSYGGTKEEQIESGFNAETAAVLTAEEVRHLFEEWITNDYHQTYHSGIRMTPQEKYQEAIDSGWRPEEPANREQLARPAGEIRYATIYGQDSEGGVQINRIKYNDVEGRLKMIGMRLRAKGEEATVKCRFSVQDIYSITVVDEIMGDEFVVQTTDPLVTPGMSLNEYNVAYPSNKPPRGYKGVSSLKDNELLQEANKLSLKKQRDAESKKQRNASPEKLHEAVNNRNNEQQDISKSPLPAQTNLFAGIDVNDIEGLEND